jgi:hypothetical protein
MLERSDVAARLPAQDLERAKAFYADKARPKTNLARHRPADTITRSWTFEE